MSKENRFGEAVGLLMDAATLINNQCDIAKRIDDFIGSVHPAECVDLPPEGISWIACSERMPEPGAFVAIYTSGDGVLGVIYESSFPSHPWKGEQADYVPEEVTHWTALPKRLPQNGIADDRH